MVFKMVASEPIYYMDEGEKSLFLFLYLSKKIYQMGEILSHIDYCFFFYYIYLL